MRTLTELDAAVFVTPDGRHVMALVRNAPRLGTNEHGRVMRSSGADVEFIVVPAEVLDRPLTAADLGERVVLDPSTLRRVGFIPASVRS